GHWGVGLPRVRKNPGENDARALGRTLSGLLGRLRGEVSGQTIRVERRHVAELTVWVGEGRVDWERPVTIEVDGRTAFAGLPRPAPGVCLARGAGPFDFARLRWAGVRIDARGAAALVTADTPFPPLLPESLPEAVHPQARAPRRAASR